MKIVNLTQGTPEWLAHRAKHFNASDAPAMLGCSPYKSRRDLLREMKTGITPEVDEATRKRFNNGHRLEALARPIAEKIIGDTLYPVTGVSDCGRYSASFDGLTLDETTGFEHKALNADLRDILANDRELALMHRAQMEHQMLVSGADRILFMASEFDAQGNLIEAFHRWYESSPELRAHIVNGWDQFEADLAAFELEESVAPAPVGNAPETLPALRIEVRGEVIASNIAAFRETALATIRGVNRELKTDQHFADAELSVKWCKAVEERVEAAKAHALSQTATIDELFQALDSIAEESRRVRLDLEKRVKVRKEEIKHTLVADATKALAKHVAALNFECGAYRIGTVEADFAGAIKGKRSIDAMEDAIDATLAAAKIEADAKARVVRANIVTYRERSAGLEYLFADLAQHVGKPESDFLELVTSRVERHKAAEEARKAREESERLRREAEAKAEAERRLAEAEAKLAEANRDIMTEAQARERFGLTREALSVAESEARERAAVEPEHPDDEPATVTLGDIAERLGFKLPESFICGLLDVQPAARVRKNPVFTETQFVCICGRLEDHIANVRKTAREAVEA